MDLIIRNATLTNSKGHYDIGIKNGKFNKIERNIELKAETEIDANGNLVSPPFVESHVHLDSALSAGIPRFNQSGTLLEAIHLWSEFKQNINKQDIKNRARQAIHWLIAQGVLHIRTHTDCTEPN